MLKIRNENVPQKRARKALWTLFLFKNSFAVTSFSFFKFRYISIQRAIITIPTTKASTEEISRIIKSSLPSQPLSEVL